MLTARTSRQEIREAIQASGRTQEEAAAAIGISPVTLSRWLNGHADPAFDKLDLLATAIGQPITLTFGKHTKEPPPEWAGAMEERLTEALLANRKVFVDTMATHFAQLGVERALADQLPSEPDPETRELLPGSAEPT